MNKDKDKLVIDIETKNTFFDVGGKDNLRDLDASLVCIYSYNRDEMLNFREDEFDKMNPILQDAGLVIGFSIRRFDLPVLEKYLSFNPLALPMLDLLEVVEEAYGKRVGLDVLAKQNLGVGKTNHGLDAIKFYKQGDWASLERYCQNDVIITRDLYEFMKEKGYVDIPDRKTNEIFKVALAVNDSIQPANTLF